ncbi:MAG: siderophore-interacting protein [Pseudomonadota bacterium]
MADPGSALLSSARLKVADAPGLIRALGARFADHAAITPTETGAVLEAEKFGRLTLCAEGDTLTAQCESPSASALAFLKMYTAEGLVELAGPDASALAWSGETAGVLPFFREMQVARTEAVTPLMRRVVLAGDAAHFEAADALHVRVLIPPAGRAPVWPHAGADGRMIWPPAPDALVPRVYTVRRVDLPRGEIAIDVVLHGGISTPGADWARGAGPGDVVGLLGPGGAAPAPAPVMLLAGDETALPAIARCLETLPAGTRAIVRLEVQDEQEIQPLPSPATLDLRYLLRGAAEPGCSSLLDAAIAELDLAPHLGTLRAFVACEQAEARRIRARLAAAGVPKDRRLVAAYWRRGQAGVDLDG